MNTVTVNMVNSQEGIFHSTGMELAHVLSGTSLETSTDIDEMKDQRLITGYVSVYSVRSQNGAVIFL